MEDYLTIVKFELFVSKKKISDQLVYSSLLSLVRYCYKYVLCENIRTKDYNL